MTTRLGQAIADIGLATCGRLGARLASHLGIATSWMTIVRHVMTLPTQPVEHVSCLGIDDFSFLRGRTFGTVLVDLDTHHVIDLLPDRQTETAAAWMQAHKEITYVSRDRGAQYASAAPQAVQVADRFHVVKNLSEAVADLLSRVLTELNATLEGEGEGAGSATAQGGDRVAVEEWRPALGEQIKRMISTHRAEREARYQYVESLQKQGLTSKEIARRLGVSE